MPVAAISDATRDLIEVIAAAIRDELGAEIDAYPGGRVPEQADPINRAFRAVVTALLRDDKAPSPTTVSLALRTVAERRLAADGFEALQARCLLDEEPAGCDDWLAFLILSSRSQVADALAPDDADHA